jgi:hypothetical protein
MARHIVYMYRQVNFFIGASLQEQFPQPFNTIPIKNKIERISAAFGKSTPQECHSKSLPPTHPHPPQPLTACVA